MLVKKVKMQTQAFIKEAQSLIKDIKDLSALQGIQDYDSEARARQQVQKRLNQSLNRMRDPYESNTYTPSAYQLRDAAVAAGFEVNPDTNRAINFYDRTL